MLSRIFWPLALGLAVLAPLAVRAEVTIDTFDTAQAVQAPLGGPDAAIGVVTAPEVIGGERDVRVERTSGGGAVQFQSGVAGQEHMLCSLGAGAEGSCLVVWDGPDGSFSLDPAGLGGIDLTEGGANDAVGFTVQVDQPVTIEVEVVRASDGESVSAILDLQGGPAVEERFLPLASFGPEAEAVFGDAGAISLLVTGTPGFDALIDDVRVTVPEPGSSAAAAVLALVAVCARRRAATDGA